MAGSPTDRLALVSVQADEWVCALSDGRNKAVVLGGEDAAGDRRECVVKLSTTTMPVEWLVEWLASAFAQGLELPVAAPCRVEISPELRDLLPRPATHSVVFGSTYCAGGCQVPRGFRPERERLGVASGVIAFDALVHNPDRCASNPNLLLMANRDLLMIDHDLAFSWLFALGVGDASTMNVANESWMLEHCLREGVMHRLRTVPTDLRDAISCLDDMFYERIVTMTPVEWTHGKAQGYLEKIVNVTRQRLNKLSDWLVPLENGWMR